MGEGFFPNRPFKPLVASSIPAALTNPHTWGFIYFYPLLLPIWIRTGISKIFLIPMYFLFCFSLVKIGQRESTVVNISNQFYEKVV
jgi:hypothetical protein